MDGDYIVHGIFDAIFVLDCTFSFLFLSEEFCLSPSKVLCYYYFLQGNSIIRRIIEIKTRDFRLNYVGQRVPDIKSWFYI